MTTPSGTTPTPVAGASGGSGATSGTASATKTAGASLGPTEASSTAASAKGASAKGATTGSGSGSTPAPTAVTSSTGPGASAKSATATATSVATPGSGKSASPAARKPTGQPRPATTTRRVRLAVARVDPWSVMKVSFLLSFAAGVAMVVATILLWMVLSGLNVFGDIDRVIRDIQPTSAEPFSVLNYIGLPRVTALSMVIAVIDVILITAIATLSAYLYNICSSLVGGIQLTLTDD